MIRNIENNDNGYYRKKNNVNDVPIIIIYPSDM